VIKHIHIELAMMGQSGQREVAAAEIAHNGIDRISAEQELKLVVERMAQEQLNREFVVFDLAREPTQPGLVRICRHADR